MVGVLVGAIFAAALGTFFLYATSHPEARASRALFWWSRRLGNGPADSKVTQLVGYVTGFFWLALATVALAAALR